MTDPKNFDIARIQRRIALINDTCNAAVLELSQTGRLRVNVERAFQNADDCIKLIGIVALLKRYAETAALQHGQVLDLGTWNGFFEQFERDCHIAPSGKLS
jgi:hypothetical protein